MAQPIQPSAAATTTTPVVVTPNPATPVTSTTPAAQTTTQPIVQQTTTTPQAVAPTTTTPIVQQSQAASSAAPIASTPSSNVPISSVAPSSATSSRSSSSIPIPSVAATTTHSSSLASSSTTFSVTGSAIIAGASPTAATSTHRGLSTAAIGGIAGGAVGGLLIVTLLFFCWRRNRNKDERLPPPPPRDMTYVTSTYHRNRAQSNAPVTGATINRASSYSTLLAARPSSTYQSHSRHQSAYYNTYPVATPASTDTSPPMEPVEVESPPFTGAPSSGNTTPGSAGKPVLAVQTGSLRRGDSSSSSSDVAPARRMPSIDRLRSEAGADRSGSGSPSNMYPFPPSGNSSEPGSGPSSPHPSSHSHHPSTSGYPSPSSYSHARMSSLSPNPDGRYPRPLSMASLSSSRYLHVGPAGGAPHQGRPINLEMPKLLGARPDSQGDFFNGMQRMEQGQMASFDSMPQVAPVYPAYSVPSKSYSERDMVSEMGQHQLPRRMSSAQSMSQRAAPAASASEHPHRRSYSQNGTPSYTSNGPPVLPPLPPMPQGTLAFPQPRRQTSSPSETSSNGSGSGSRSAGGTSKSRRDPRASPRV